MKNLELLLQQILFPKLQWNEYKLRLRFEGSCLKQEDTTIVTPNNLVNLFTVYELDSCSQDLEILL